MDDFWTTRRRDRGDVDNVRPLLKALAEARRSLEEDHPGAPVSELPDAVVLDIRPAEWADHPSAQPPPVPEPEPTPARPADPPRAAAQSSAPDWIMVEGIGHTPPPQPKPAPEWGDLWRESVQGWVRTADGTKIWRPIVTTTTAVPNWEIDTNLGMVTGESACSIDGSNLTALIGSPAGSESLRRELAQDRGIAQAAMVDEAVARGAHAVIGVKLDYTALADCLIVTATGTAVTLRSAR